MQLDKKDLELIESIVYKSADDIAISIARSFERLEERIDCAESRIYSRLAELDDLICEVREIVKGSDEVELDWKSIRTVSKMETVGVWNYTFTHNNMKKSKSNNYEAKDIIAIYTNEKGETELMADVVKDTLWATESQIAEIFLTTQQNVNLHLRARS